MLLKNGELAVRKRMKVEMVRVESATDVWSYISVGLMPRRGPDSASRHFSQVLAVASIGPGEHTYTGFTMRN